MEAPAGFDRSDATIIGARFVGATDQVNAVLLLSEPSLTVTVTL
jgi:hypothetical protein